MPSVTFDDVTGALLGSYHGRVPPTPQAQLLTMVARLGDLAALCATTGDVRQTDFERSEVNAVIGEVAVALCGLGASLDVDVGAAAATVARKRCAEASKRGKRDTLRPDDVAAIPSPRHGPPADGTSADTTPGSQQQQHGQRPRSSESTTPMAAHRPPPLSVPSQTSLALSTPTPDAAQQVLQQPEASGAGRQPSSQTNSGMPSQQGSATFGVSNTTADPQGSPLHQRDAQQQSAESEAEERARWQMHADAARQNVARQQAQQQQQQRASAPQAAVAQQQQQQQQQQQPAAAAGVPEGMSQEEAARLLLSPKTTKAFFPELDKVATQYNSGRLSRAEYSELYISYTVVDDHGEIIDLLPNGRSKLVPYEDFPAYVRMAEHLRHGAAKPPPLELRALPSGGVPGPATAAAPDAGGAPAGPGLMSPLGPAPVPGYEMRRIGVEARPDPRQHGNFSPDHFRGGIFSPRNDKAYVDVMYPVPGQDDAAAGSPPRQQTTQQQVATAAAAAFDLRSPNGLGAARPGDFAMPPGAAVAPLSHSPPATTAHHQQHDQQPPTQLTSPQAHMPLTQASPDSQQQQPGSSSPQNATAGGGRPIAKKEEDTFWRKISIIESREATGNGIAALELTLEMPDGNGRMVPLTTNGQFLPVTASNAQDFLALIREQQQLKSGKLRRMDSVKALAMPNPASFSYKKEARQYGHDRRTASTDQLMAPAPPQRTVFYVDFDERAVEEVEPPALKRRTIPHFLPSAAHYLDFIMTSPESFKDIVKAASRDHSLVSRLQLTYCVPDPNAILSPHFVASLPAGARPRCGVRDLIEGGRNTRVKVDDWDRFVSLVLHASESLPAAVAVTL